MEEKTLKFIEKFLAIKENPICLCSFGKDSLVMLHLILRIKKIPVIYWREPFYQKKFTHPERIMKEWDLEVYDYPPTQIEYFQINDYFDIFNFYWVNNLNCMNVYTGTRNYKNTDKEFLCARKDLLERPKVPSFEFKWDCIFHGHKQCDPNYLTEKIILRDNIPMGNILMVLPIKDWTDRDIWDYIKKYDLPYNRDRYDRNNEDYNNDIFPTCHNCLDYRTRGEKVYCPKLEKEILNIGKSYNEHLKLRDFLLSNRYLKEECMATS